MKFIDVLHRGRERRKPNPALQERIAQWTVYPPHRNVQAAPVKPPVRKNRSV